MTNRDQVVKQVQAAIERETRSDGQNSPIGLTYSAGTVMVVGEVANIAAKKRALKAAAGVDGVRAITDHLRVAAGSTPGDGATRDAVCKQLLGSIDFRNCGLHARIKGLRETLRDAGPEASGTIEVAVEDGVVTLSGQVLSLSHKRLAGVLAWWAQGCRDVVNALAVTPSEEDNDDEIVDALHLVLEADPYVHADRIGIGSTDHVVTLEGTVSSHGEKSRAEMDAWYLYAVDGVINHLEVR
ncbi:MAG TPA: BON domain-containing protein [Azonexus sp.]|nr:BON domain-containing protein [Azonexus sp.]